MPTSRVIVVLYAFVAATNITAIAADHDSLFWATKPLLMPLLIGVLVAAAREARTAPSALMIAGLGFATLGDIALMIDGTVPFLAGMVAFLACHVCYITAFGKAGAWRRMSKAVPILYPLAVVGASVWLWSGLDALALPVTLYAVALGTMASASSGLGWRVGVGGLLFFVSDLLIAVDIAQAATLPGPPIWVMLTYVLGQALIVLGWSSARVPSPVTVPGQRTAAADGAAAGGAAADGAAADELEEV
jgi:uncharacterized membrane protein YhhN